ncbi:hypothetical protein [Burkholderia cenocepacia]|uniref:hypothetical protein n=1 Tax=Burkholderia cenocepacia TaxID=95486 RepID=UPI0021AB2954|nr:hypothetical protein [Burkholderia cenocepacia]
MKKWVSTFHGCRFTAAVISCTARLYYHFNQSLRNSEELLLERGVAVKHESMCNKV